MSAITRNSEQNLLSPSTAFRNVSLWSTGNLGYSCRRYADGIETNSLSSDMIYVHSVTWYGLRYYGGS